MTSPCTWALIADGARAHVLTRNGHEHRWVEVDGMSFTGDHAATRDLVADREGRSFSPGGSGRSAIQSRSDPHRRLKLAFAERMMEVLAKALDDEVYQRLIIAAPPATLGDLRKAMPDRVRAAVVLELNHDLTKIPIAEIGEHLKPRPAS